MSDRTIYQQTSMFNNLQNKRTEEILGPLFDMLLKVTFMGMLTRKRRRKNETSQIIQERKVIVIFLSFIIALSTEHFSKYFLHFSQKRYRQDKIENKFL